jgi:nifR3 family TIM-barrel protein
MLKIGTILLKNWLLMAPMAGYTTLPFRLMAKKMGAGCVTSEMVSSKGLVLRHPRTLSYLKSHPDEKPLCVQIFGSQPEVMATAAQMAVQGGADMVDINMGCPVKKVVKTGAGAALLRDLKKADQMISSVRRACSAPLTVKIRAGWSPGDTVALELARVIESCGADAVTVHPRYATQGFSSPADWQWIRRIKEQIRIPVIGNGDVTEPSLAFRMKRETGCDGVMIGRAAIRNPWIFRQIERSEQGLPEVQPDPSARKACILEHFTMLCETMDESKAAQAIKGFVLAFSKGLPGSSLFRERICKMKDARSLVTAVDNFFIEQEQAED